jgi:amino acid transporter
MASLGGIIGSGWLFGSLYGAQIAGPAAIISWIVGGIGVLLIGLVYAELGGALPQAGAIVRYPQYSHGTFVSFLMGWAAMVAYASVPPIEVTAVIQYGSHYVSGIYANGSLTPLGIVIGILLLILFFFLNYFGVRVFATTNTFWTIIKFIVPALTIVVMLFSLHGSNFSHYGGFAPTGTSSILAAIPLGGIIFSYLGFRQALDLAGEAKNPQRDVPRAVVTAIVLGIVVYVLLQFVFIGAMPASLLGKGWAGLQLNSPFADLAGKLGLGWLVVILTADAVWSPGGTGNVYTASTSRVLYALQRNGYFPRVFGHVSEGTRVPVWALVATVLLGVIFLLPFPSWNKLVGIVSSATVFTYIVGPITIAVLRRTAPELRRPFRLGGTSVIAPIAFVIASLIIYWSGWATDSVVLLVILFGVVLYAYGTSSFAQDTAKFGGRNITAGIWLVVYCLVMLAMTYIGSKNFGAPHPVVPYPWDVVVVIVLGLIFYYWGVASGIVTDEAERANRNEPTAIEV